MSANAALLKVDELCVTLGGFSLDRVSLALGRGEYHMLLGPSGSGKSTFLKCLLGFHPVRSGTIALDGREITRELPERRHMGYLPQSYGLFPHLDVEENLRFGLGRKRGDRQRADAIVDEMVSILQIGHLRGRRVNHLSGGEKQKVALGRALAARPRLILLDEPFSSIDEGGKRALWLDLKRIVREVGITTLHITHNLEEAYTLGENLSVLIGGRLVQSGPKQEIFERPREESIAAYLNYGNLFRGSAEPAAEGARIAFSHFSLMVGERLAPGEPVTVCIRPQDIKIVRENAPLKDSLKRNSFPGTVVALFPLPESCLMWFRMENSPKEYDLEIKFPLHIRDRHNLYPGKKVSVAVWEPKIIVF